MTSYNHSDGCSVATGNVGSPLLRLPLELRRRIYAFIFGHRHPIDLRHVRAELDPWWRSMIYQPQSEKLNHMDLFEWRTGITGVSRAISNESLDVLYGQNVFIVHIHRGGFSHIFSKMGVANSRRIRFLRVVARPMGICYGKPMVFNPQIWLPLLDGLLQFCIVAHQPLTAEGYYGASTLEQDLREWTVWLDPILKYFSRNLPKTTAVGLDDDDHAETTAVMDKHFDSGYQKVRTITGDSYFQRGQYLIESGCWVSESD
ncbi:hypothetical protein G7Y79_00049g085000 [Physcia stellaris]|nr:hypothetical protein G7Y79_00049g085000 [Physcia stellaris]